MAQDLVMGNIDRDWSCGKLVVQPRPDADRPWVSVRDPAALGEEARSRVAGAASLAVRLSKTGRLPKADQAQFAKFHRRWTDFYSKRSGRFGQRDVLLLWNFCEAAKKLRARLDAFEAIASTPSKAPPEALAVGAPPAAPAAPKATLWAVLAGAVAALLGVELYRSRKAG